MILPSGNTSLELANLFKLSEAISAFFSTVVGDCLDSERGDPEIEEGFSGGDVSTTGRATGD